MLNELKAFDNLPSLIIKNDNTPESLKGRFTIEVLRIIDKARVIYNLDENIANQIEIRFSLKGFVAGRAGRDLKGLYLDFNFEAIEKYWDEMVNSTIPHEVAHIVAYLLPKLCAKGHNKHWKRIDATLGGDGELKHNMRLTAARKTKQHIYIVGGYRIRLSTVRHNRIMKKGQRYIYSVGGSSFRITAEHYTGVDI